MIILCCFKWIDFAHSADGMLIDVNRQHYLDSLSDKKLNRHEIISALASKVTFSGQGYYALIQYFLMRCCIYSVCGGKCGVFLFSFCSRIAHLAFNSVGVLGD